MQIFTVILLGFLLVCAISVSFSKKLLNSILIYMSYSLVMAIIWVLLESPDLAITEAAVGAGITSVLFFVTLKKIRAILRDERELEEVDESQEDAVVAAAEAAVAQSATTASAKTGASARATSVTSSVSMTSNATSDTTVSMMNSDVDSAESKVEQSKTSSEDNITREGTILDKKVEAKSRKQGGDGA